MRRTPEQWLEIVSRDFGGTPVATAGVTMARCDADGDAPWFRLGVARNWTRIDDTPDTARLAVEIASYLQDFAMDELHRPWPEVQVAGATVVLEPRLDAGGAPVWSAHGVEVAFGALHGVRSPQAGP